MSYTNASSGSGSRSARRTVEFGRTYVVRPKGKHQATVVWLHGLGDNGSSWSQLLDNSLANIKWICPTAPTRPVTVLGGFPCTAWFDEGELSDDGPKDVEVKLGIGGFSMGAACALYCRTCFVQGRYGNGSPYPVNFKRCCRVERLASGGQNLRNMMEGSHDAIRRAASLPVLLCHGVGDEVVPYKFGERSSQILSSVGFRYVYIQNIPRVLNKKTLLSFDLITNVKITTFLILFFFLNMIFRLGHYTVLKKWKRCVNG
uniref:Putative alpha/Beta hydrolase fold protein n=1 Tax=Helianthus annuus TaxID=4232 RepID=A0A1Y3BX64_HELAN